MNDRTLRACWMVMAAALIFVSSSRAQTSCSVGYSETSSWSGGFNGGITIYNTGTTTIPTWSLGFAFANGQIVSNSWNSTYSQNGTNVTLTNGQYAGNIAPGGSVNSVGFTASWNNTTNAIPTAFTLNGVACSFAPTAGTFTVSGSSSVSIAQGGGGGEWISVNGSGGFNGTVSFVVSGLPSGVISGFSPNPGGSGTWLQLNLYSSVAAGSYPITVKGTSGNQSATLSFALIVQQPGSFTLSASPSPLTVQPGGNCPAQISVAGQNDFGGSVTLGASGLPSGVTASFGTNPTTSGSSVNIGVPSSFGTGNYTLTVNGVSGSLSASTALGLTVSNSVMTVTPEVTTMPFAQNLVVNVALTCGNGMPTGTVVLSGPGYTSAPVTLGNGNATFYVQPGSLAVGSDTLKATYTPDSSSSSNYGTLTATAAVTVTAPGSNNQTVSINARANRHLISPYIYGINSLTESDVTALSPGLVRFGGNEASDYNWKLHTYNTGSDWWFNSYSLGNIDSVQFTSFTKSSGSQMLTTMPMLDWVAKSSGYSFSVQKYGPQCASQPGNPDEGNGYETDCQTQVVNDPNDAYYPLVDAPTNCPSGTSDGTTCLDRETWAQALAGAFGSGTCSVPYTAINSCHFYDMDNEPEIWNGSHRDIHPAKPGYTELLNSFEQEGTALKSWDPSAVRFGPIPCCWSFLWSSGPTGDDKNAHAGIDYAPWFINRAYWMDQISGNRTLDVFDMHAYFGDNINNSGYTNAQLRAEVPKYVRTYWDPTYYIAGDDANWITTTQPNRGVNLLIPRMKAMLNAIYPGTPLSFSEWESFFSNWEFTTALSDADAYGVMGREGLSFSTRWGGPSAIDGNTNEPDPNYTSFKLWTNYDGAHHGFGTLSISDQSPANPDLFVSYAALNSTGTAMTIMVLNKDAGNTASVTFNLAGFNATSYTSYTVSSINPTVIVSSQSRGWSNTQSFAPFSITLLVVNGAESPAPATEWYMKADDLMVPAGSTGLLNPSNYSGSTNVTISSAAFDSFEGAPACNGTLNVTSNTIYQYWPAFIYFTAPTTPGFCHYTVTGNDGTGTSTQSGWIIVSNPSGTVSITSGNGQSGAHGSALSAPLTVTLNPGASGLSAQNAEIFFTTSAGTLSNGSASGSKVIATTNASGVASVTLTLPPTGGTVTVTAQSQFALGGTTVTFTETAQ